MADQTASPNLDSISEGVRLIAATFLDREPTDLQRFCEVAVMDLDPGQPYSAYSDLGTVHLTAEQARHAVAAVLATLAYFNRLPTAVIR